VPRHENRHTRHVVPARRAAPVYLFEEDAELRGALSGLPESDARVAAELLAGCWELAPGAWDPERDAPGRQGNGGILLLDGFVLCELGVGPRSSAELFAAGDLVWTAEPRLDGQPTLPTTRTWRVLAPTRLVALERGLMARLGRLPGIATSLQRRLAAQARSLNVRLAIVQIPQLTIRLHLLLWHLADRWGRSCSEGAVIPHRLSHQVLAELVSAQRTSVGAALHQLQEAGVVGRNDEGLWVVRTKPPSEFV